MNELSCLCLSLLISYLLGSIPFGYLAGLTRGIDVRTVGSGNVGATNVFRAVSHKLGIATFVCDVLKGTLAVCLVPRLVRLAAGADPAAIPAWVLLCCGIAALAGHGFPVFLHFRGGKGVATGLGIALGLVPHCALIALLVWIVCFLLSRYVSLASCIAAGTVAVLCWFLDRPPAGDAMHVALPVLVTLLALGIVARHHGNLRRLMQGTENRFCFTKRQLEARERAAKAKSDREAAVRKEG